MRILVMGPMAYSWGGDGYGRVERLCGLLVGGLAEAGYELVVVCPVGSELVGGITRVESDVDVVYGELRAYERVREVVSSLGIDFVLDLSHQHLLRVRDGWPGLSWIWHDPMVNVGVRWPRDGLMALSGWQARRFREVVGVDCGVLDIHMVGGGYRHEAVEGSGRWLWLGRLDRDKGVMEAVSVFEESGDRLDVVGPGMDIEVVRMMKMVEKETMGRIRWLGEVSEDEKLRYLKSALGLWYWPEFGEGVSEAHSMKTVEAVCCGLPVLMRNKEPYPEVFHGLVQYMDEPEVRVVERDRGWLSERALEEWSVKAVVRRIEREMGVAV